MNIRQAVQICAHSKKLIAEFINDVYDFAETTKNIYPQKYNENRITISDFQRAYVDIDIIENICRIGACDVKTIAYIRNTAFRIYTLHQNLLYIASSCDTKNKSVDWQMLLLIATTYDVDNDMLEDIAEYIMTNYDMTETRVNLNELIYPVSDDEINQEIENTKK